MATKIIYPDGWELEIDATIKQQHGRKATLTKHKVEKGAEVSDHRVKENYTFSLDGIISEFTIFLGGGNGPGEAMERIESAYDNDLLLEVVTEIKTYKNMTIAGYSFPREVGHGNSLFFSLEFEELRIAETKSVKVKDIPKSALQKSSAKMTTEKKVKETNKLRKRHAPKKHRGPKKGSDALNILSKYGF